MNATENLPPTDSSSTLRNILGDDATATFENDPKFIDSDPADRASSENLGEAPKEDGPEALSMARRSALDEEDDDEADVDPDLDEDDDLEDDEDEDEDDEEYEDEDDDEEEYEDDDEEDDDDDEEEEDDDVEELKVSAASSSDLDDDSGDVDLGLDEDELEQDDLDTDRVASDPAYRLVAAAQRDGAASAALSCYVR